MKATSRKQIAISAPGSSIEGTPRLCPFILVCAFALILGATAARADWIPTNFGTGADAEIRDHQPSTNFGASTEIATRILNAQPPGGTDVTDRFSAMYTRFDLSGVPLPLPAQFSAAFRLTFRNTNLTVNRLHDTGSPNFSHRAGLAVYFLSQTAPAWTESTITYGNAPGITSDGNNGTKDLNSLLTPLGTVTLPTLGVQNRLAVGASVVFRSPALNNAIRTVINAGLTQITLVTTTLHSGEDPTNDWKNFNYLFNPKEQTTLIADIGYDSDVTNPSNPLGGPHSSASNSTGAFSPAIRIDPLPITDPLPPFSIIDVDVDQVDLQVGPTALDGFPYQIERSGDLYHWVRVGTVTSGLIPTPWSDERLPGENKKFYRLTR